MSIELTTSTYGSRRPSILIVDDEPHVCTLLARWLASEGMDCIVAGSTSEAIAVLETTVFDLVAADVIMPGGSGLTLLERAKAIVPDVAVLMLTASGDTQVAIDALTRGASGYLLKPVQREEYVFQVRQALERQQLLLERRQYTQMLERRVQEQTIEIRQAHEETIHRLVTATMCRDEETGAHIRRTGLLSEALALAAGWSASEAERLRMAAPMHDVGKIGIPDSILQKPGPLTPDEFEIMKRHTVIGARMLAGSTSPVLQLAEAIARSHHERWDGKGYPDGLFGHQIPEAARILSIVDVYDAISHDRVYRPAMAEDQVLSTIRQGQGSQFDPEVVVTFLAAYEQLREISASNPDAEPSDTLAKLPLVICRAAFQ